MEDTKLDRAQIVLTTVRLLQEEGIDAFSMRKLAARLDIRAPTLYWYFPDRSAILSEVIKVLLVDTMNSVGKHPTWQEWLRAFGLALWRTNCETPFVTMLLQSAELNDSEVFKIALEMLDTALRQYPVDHALALRAHSDIQALVLGWAVFHHAGVAERIQPMFDVSLAVTEGIEGIIRIWEIRMAERQI